MDIRLDSVVAARPGWAQAGRALVCYRPAPSANASMAVLRAASGYSSAYLPRTAGPEISDRGATSLGTVVRDRDAQMRFFPKPGKAERFSKKNLGRLSEAFLDGLFQQQVYLVKWNRRSPLLRASRGRCGGLLCGLGVDQLRGNPASAQTAGGVSCSTAATGGVPKPPGPNGSIGVISRRSLRYFFDLTITYT
jgi:hypothetical protein